MRYITDMGPSLSPLQGRRQTKQDKRIESIGLSSKQWTGSNRWSWQLKPV